MHSKHLRVSQLFHPALFVSPWIEASCFPSLLVSFHCDALWIRVWPVDVRREKARRWNWGIWYLNYAPICRSARRNLNLNPGFVLRLLRTRCPKEKRRGVDASGASPAAAAQSRIGNAESTRPRGIVPPAPRAWTPDAWPTATAPQVLCSC